MCVLSFSGFSVFLHGSLIDFYKTVRPKRLGDTTTRLLLPPLLGSLVSVLVDHDHRGVQ